MKQRFLKYLDKIDYLLKADDPDTDWEKILSEHLNQTSFFQHERLAHLIVTVTFGLILILMTNLIKSADGLNYLIFILFFVIAVMLILYILYYYFLEKSVQKLYRQYDEIVRRKRIKI